MPDSVETQTPTPAPTKPWYQSITIWAAAAVGFLQTLPTILTQIDATTGLHLSADPTVMKVMSIIGVIVAIYGRLTAKAVVK